MNPDLKAGADSFADYLQSIVRLEALQKMTEDLDEELADSQRIMNEIKAMYESIPKTRNDPATEQPNNGLRQEDKSEFLESNVPKLLLPDMTENTGDVDLDDCIAKMKNYAESLKKNFICTQPQPRDPCKPIEKLDLEQYATNLDQLGKRLANIKLNKKNNMNNRSAELEAKLTLLYDDVNMFTQMVKAKTSISQFNDEGSQSQQETNALYYDNIINKLLSGINEVTYLLQNKN